MCVCDWCVCVCLVCVCVCVIGCLHARTCMHVRVHVCVLISLDNEMLFGYRNMEKEKSKLSSIQVSSFYKTNRGEAEKSPNILYVPDFEVSECSDIESSDEHEPPSQPLENVPSCSRANHVDFEMESEA